MKKIWITVTIAILVACTDSKKGGYDALTYNETLVKEINKTDSSRNLMGDKDNETLSEFIQDLAKFKNQVDSSLAKVEKANFNNDTTFKNSVLRYLLLNKGLSEIDFPNIIKLKTKLDTASTKNKEEIYGLMFAISENMQHNLERRIKEIETNQSLFAKRYKIKLQ